MGQDAIVVLYIMSSKVDLQVYYGVSSPWAYLGAKELERIATKYNILIHLKPIFVITENGGYL